MSEFLHKLGDLMNIGSRYWLDWKMCTPSWIIDFMWSRGFLVSIAYLLFTITALATEKRAGKLLKVRGFFFTLSIVFLLCSFLHFIHVHSKYEPEYLVLTRFIYEPLLLSMCLLLYLTFKIRKASFNLIHIDDVNQQVLQKDNEIQELKKIINEYGITESALSFSKSKLALSRTLREADDEYVIMAGKNWEMPIPYDKWLRYKSGDSVCRLIGFYLNDETTCTINEFPAMEFPTHEHDFSEVVVVLSGEIVMNNKTYKKGEVAFFKGGEKHNLKTKGARVAVVWGKKIHSIQGKA